MDNKFASDFSMEFGNDWGLYIDIENANFVFPNNHEKMREIHGIKNQSYQDYQKELYCSLDKNYIEKSTNICLKNKGLFQIYSRTIITSILTYIIFFLI